MTSEFKTRLVFKEVDFQAIRAHLLQSDGLERASFALLGERKTESLLELYVHRLLLPGDTDYSKQHQAIVEPKAEYILDTFSRFAQSQLVGYLHAHSHPFADNASFSGTDDYYLPGMKRSLKQYLLLTGKQNEFLFVRLVWGQKEDGFTAECFTPDGSLLALVEELKVVGKHGIRTISSFSTDTEITKLQAISGLFQRQVAFLGEDGQRSIQKVRLAICGVGGLGSSVVACAKGLGFRDITLIDPDLLDESNLNRFQGANISDIGKPKVEVVAAALGQFDPDIKVTPIQAQVEDLAAHQAISNADFIISCLDNDSARMEVQLLAASHLKPLLDLGSGIILEPGTRTVKEMGGQARLYYPGGPCLLCQGLDPTSIISTRVREIQRAVGYIAGTDETPPSVVTINSAVAGWGLHIAINYLTGFTEAPIYLRYDLLRHHTTQYSFTKRADCPICGEEGIEGKGEPTTPSTPSTGKHRLPSAVDDYPKHNDGHILDRAKPTLSTKSLLSSRFGIDLITLLSIALIYFARLLLFVVPILRPLLLGRLGDKVKGFEVKGHFILNGGRKCHKRQIAASPLLSLLTRIASQQDQSRRA